MHFTHFIRKFGSLFFLLLYFASAEALTVPPQDPLLGRIGLNDKRHVTFRYCLDLMAERNVKTIVETGTARYGTLHCYGDGCSTVIWGHWASIHNASVYTVDISPDSINASQAACTCYRDNITFICDDSVNFIKNFKKPIDFLYLDSYDCDVSDPNPSQEHHLKEIKAAYPHLHKKSIIMIDDCDHPTGGKGKLVIEYLLDKGWKAVLSAYQVVLLYE